MFVLKICIGALAIVVCVKIAKSKAYNLKIAYYFYKDLCVFCKDFEVNLTYKKASVKNLALNDYSTLEFNNLIQSYADKCNVEDVEFPGFLNDKELLEVKSLFNIIGQSDTQSQLIAIRNYYKIFSDLTVDKKSAYNKYYSIFLKIGFSVGLMILIMVI